MTLSGRVETLENQVTYITQDLLQKIDLSTSSTRSTQMNQQLDTIENSVDVLTTQLRTLQSLYTNLYMNVRDNYADFTGYTGDPDTDLTALSATVAKLDPEYAAMYQTGATIYSITSELTGTFLGSVGATGSVSKDIDIQLYGSIGANNPPQDQFVVNTDGVYRFTTTFAMKADDIPGGNTATVDSAIATGTASGIVPGSDFQFDLTDTASATSRTVGITKMLSLVSGQNVMLVGKADRECTLSIQTSLMNLEKVYET